MITPQNDEETVEYIKLSLSLISKVLSSDFIKTLINDQFYAVTSYGAHITTDNAVDVLNEITDRI